MAIFQITEAAKALFLAAASIWFEIWGVVDPGEKIWIIQGKFPKNFDFFQAIFTKKISIFPGKFPKVFDFSGNLKNFFEFPGKNWPFTDTSWQIILFPFKSHHF